MTEKVFLPCLVGLFRLMALLPLGALYVFSDILYLIIYYVVRYRRNVVKDNLTACFPDYGKETIDELCRKFYRNFTDYIVETVKLLHISDKEMSRRMSFENVELIDRLVEKKRDVLVYFSHCGNWEWAPSVTLHTGRRPGQGVEYCQVYRPLSSRCFDSIMLSIRSRFGSLSFAKSSVLRDLIRLRREGMVSVTGFMSDQKPSHGDPTVPLIFLGRPTAFISGTETLARKLGMAAIYWDMEKVARGRYRIVCRLISEDVSTTNPGEVTSAYASMLEKTIRRNPSIWLWTHKRWKNPVIMP